MRKTIFSVHNNQLIEIFCEKNEKEFEMWLVAVAKSNRIIVDHRLTHDDFERRLEYAKENDLKWHNATKAELPKEKHKSAIEMQETISRGQFINMQTSLNQSLVYYLASNVNLMPIDRTEWNKAKNAILGQWTDGVATVCFKPNAELLWSCPIGKPHPLNPGVRPDEKIPDWWSFASWQLHLMNYENKKGIRIGVIRVDENQLHVWSALNPQRLAHVFYRA